MIKAPFSPLLDDDPSILNLPEHRLLMNILLRALCDLTEGDFVERKDVRSARRFFGHVSAYEHLMEVEDHSDPGCHGTLAYICTELGPVLAIDPLEFMRGILRYVFDGREISNRLRTQRLNINGTCGTKAN